MKDKLVKNPCCQRRHPYGDVTRQNLGRIALNTYDALRRELLASKGRNGPMSSDKLSVLPADDAVVIRNSDVHSAALRVDVNGCVGRSHPDLCTLTMMVVVVFLANCAVIIALGFVR
jgi:hypothetical protein